MLGIGEQLLALTGQFNPFFKHFQGFIQRQFATFKLLNNSFQLLQLALKIDVGGFFGGSFLFWHSE